MMCSLCQTLAKGSKAIGNDQVEKSNHEWRKQPGSCIVYNSSLDGVQRCTSKVFTRFTKSCPFRTLPYREANQTAFAYYSRQQRWGPHTQSPTVRCNTLGHAGSCEPHQACRTKKHSGCALARRKPPLLLHENVNRDAWTLVGARHALELVCTVGKHLWQRIKSSDPTFMHIKWHLHT